MGRRQNKDPLEGKPVVQVFKQNLPVELKFNKQTSNQLEDFIKFCGLLKNPDKDTHSSFFEGTRSKMAMEPQQASLISKMDLTRLSSTDDEHCFLTLSEPTFFWVSHEPLVSQP